jgi:transposase InsO family protein
MRPIDCCTREIVGRNISHRCRTEDELAAAEQVVLEWLPEGSREENLTLTTNNGTQFTSIPGTISGLRTKTDFRRAFLI